MNEAQQKEGLVERLLKAAETMFPGDRALLREAAAALQEPKEGVTVPVEPTVDMLQAAVHALDGVNLSRMTRHQRATFKARKRWEAMLAAHQGRDKE